MSKVANYGLIILTNPSGLQSSYRRSSNKNKGFYWLWPGTPCIFLYFDFKYDMQVPN